MAGVGVGGCFHHWTPNHIISDDGDACERYVCIVLNTKIRLPVPLVVKLWETAEIRCTVDGGTNRWRTFLNNMCPNRRLKPPDLITGDFDSITNETNSFFDSPLSRRVHTPNQNATDFTKAITVVQTLVGKEKVNNVIVFNDTSGRFDHIIGNINTLFIKQTSSLNIYLLSGNSLTWLLQPGKHSIRIPQHLVSKQTWCALMPIGKPATSVTTTGLKWNLMNSCLEFGGVVSTSNTYADEIVHVETDTELVWSMGLGLPADDDDN